MSRDDDLGDFDGSFEATRRRQILDGLRLTPLERLHWLERTVEELSRFLGRARKPAADSADRRD